MKTMRSFVVPALAVALAASVQAAEPAAHLHDQDSGLTLDEGRRWETDQHTASAVKAMQEAVVKFQETDGDYAALGAALQKELDGLIRGCRMTGAAHEQLHEYVRLIARPIHELKTGDVDEGRAAEQEVAEVLKQFDEYFEPVVE